MSRVLPSCKEDPWFDSHLDEVLDSYIKDATRYMLHELAEMHAWQEPVREAAARGGLAIYFCRRGVTALRNKAAQSLAGQDRIGHDRAGMAGQGRARQRRAGDGRDGAENPSGRIGMRLMG